MDERTTDSANTPEGEAPVGAGPLPTRRDVLRLGAAGLAVLWGGGASADPPKSPPPSAAPGAALARTPFAFGRAARRGLPFTAVRLHDAFWSPKQRVYRERTIPHSWQYVQREIEDNEIAAGWRHETRGADTPWNQANLHKVLETCAYALGQERDPALEAKSDGIIRAIAAAQRPDGYVNALITVRHMTPWADLDGQHEGYVAGHMIEAAVAYFLSTGKREFLDVASRMADHVFRHFITEGHGGVCGHAELELALVRLYRVTGQRRHLELARNWVERRGHPWPGRGAGPRSYFMDHLPIRQVPEVTGHAVRSMFYLTGVTEVAMETGDEGLKAAARRLWRDTTRRKRYLVGSVGSQASDEGFGPAYDLPNHGYNESCAACGLVYFAHAMFTLDGAAESIDVLENTLYNAALHGISLDGTSTYYRNPLSDENDARGNVWVCCPPCLSRTLLRVQDYAYARTDRDVYVNLYVGSTAAIPLAGGVVTLTQETQYPWDGDVRLTVGLARPAAFALHLRLPGWCAGAGLKLNGAALTRPRVEDGYAVVSRRWRDGDIVTLILPMPIERVAADVRVAADRGRVAIRRGPLVYGLEGTDNGGAAITLPRDPEFRAEHRPGLLGGITVITGRTVSGGRFTAVPFYALANRGPSRQEVWVRQEAKRPAPADLGGPLYRVLGADGLGAPAE